MDPTTAAPGDGIATEEDPELTAFYADLAEAHLHPLWQITRQLLTPTPRPQALPWLWPSRTLIPLAERALRLVPVERGGERRVLSLGNPGMPGSPYVAGTLWAAIQCLGPGETAPAHRHTPGAIRFVLEGTGVSTTVDGDACDMRPGDLLLTPAWGWHDHSSTGTSRMLWFDGLDLPMIEALDAVFFEPYPEFRQPVPLAHNQTELDPPDGERFVAGAVDGPLDPHHSPLLIYRWPETDAELSRLVAASADGTASLEFVNPATGASVLPTLSCGMLRLNPGCATVPVRRTGNTVFVVYRGSGHSVIDGTRFDWEPGDMFVAPSWSAAEHHATDGTADLFTLGDAPVLRAIGIYRETRLDAPQEVRAVFAEDSTGTSSSGTSRTDTGSTDERAGTPA